MADPSVAGGDARQRQVYRSTPDAPSFESVGARFEQLARDVYTGRRDGGLNPETTFDLAWILTDWGRSSPAVRELAEQSAAGADPALLADLAGRVLEEIGYQPGFDAEPKLLAQLEEALEAVRADMRATGLAGPVRLAFLEDPGDCQRNAFAEFRGSFSCTSGISPSEGRDRVSALLAVADDLQDAAMEQLMTVWPVCPEHGLGSHPVERDGQAVWSCRGGAAGHVIAPVGGWGG